MAERFPCLSDISSFDPAAERNRVKYFLPSECFLPFGFDPSEENGKDGDVDGLGNLIGGGDGLQHHLTIPKTTAEPMGRGPSQAADFFTTRWSPSVLEVGRNLQKGERVQGG